MQNLRMMHRILYHIYFSSYVEFEDDAPFLCYIWSSGYEMGDIKTIIIECFKEMI